MRLEPPAVIGSNACRFNTLLPSSMFGSMCVCIMFWSCWLLRKSYEVGGTFAFWFIPSLRRCWMDWKADIYEEGI